MDSGVSPDPKACPKCLGTKRGVVTEPARDGRDERYQRVVATPECDACGGTGVSPDPKEAPMKHSDLPAHCTTCGVDWPAKHQGICPSCKAGLPCRTDTTDTVAPDPPCAGSRLRGVA